MAINILFSILLSGIIIKITFMAIEIRKNSETVWEKITANGLLLSLTFLLVKVITKIL